MKPQFFIGFLLIWISIKSVAQHQTCICTFDSVSAKYISKQKELCHCIDSTYKVNHIVLRGDTVLIVQDGIYYTKVHYYFGYKLFEIDYGYSDKFINIRYYGNNILIKEIKYFDNYNSEEIWFDSDSCVINRVRYIDGRKQLLEYRDMKCIYLNEYYNTGELLEQNMFSIIDTGGLTSYLYYKTGEIFSVQVFQNAQLVNSKVYDDKGSLIDDGSYESGNGILKKWSFHDTTQNIYISEECQYKDYLINGLRIFFAQNGDTISAESYLDGELHGEARYFWRNGNIESVIHYVQGSKTGTALYFNKSGFLIRSVQY